MNNAIWFVGNRFEEYSNLTTELISMGFSLNYYNKVSDAFSEINEQIPGAIIVDSDGSEIASFEFCYKVKISSNGIKPCLFILSSNKSEKMEISAFKSGADEFILKPVRNSSFLTRLETRLNNASVDKSVLFKVKGNTTLQIDKESFSVYKNQLLVPLSRKEFELLHLMACHPGKVFTREEIFKKIWNRSIDAKERTIDVHILRLRKKLGDEFFSTQKGVGYRFCA
jgi:two-component system alkaline phosphatase synthesis response regulator PhoP